MKGAILTPPKPNIKISSPKPANTGQNIKSLPVDIKALNIKVGQAIAKQRIKANMTQAAVASLLEIEPESVSRLETGFYAPSLERLAQFAAIFGCSIQSFFRDGTEDINDLILSLTDIISPLGHKNQSLTLNFMSQLVSFIENLTDNRSSSKK
jgi:transcriptional regulator with XRE-family HTH domain